MAAKTSKKKSKYSPHPALAQEEAGRARLLAATGKSWDEWVALAKAKGPKDQKACRVWLREKHGVTSMNAWWIASVATSAEEPSYDEPEKLVDALYSGAKSALRPLHEMVVDTALALGDDVIATSCKTMVPLYRKHVFVEMRPVDGAIEADLALGDVPVEGRLLPTRGRQPGDRLSHRVVLRSEADLDAEFKGWLAQAYANGAGAMKRAPTAEMPADLGKSLKTAAAKARATWDACTPAMQRDWILWIGSAKQAETRTKRIGQTIEKLAAGKKRMY